VACEVKSDAKRWATLIGSQIEAGGASAKCPLAVADNVLIETSFHHTLFLSILIKMFKLGRRSLGTALRAATKVSILSNYLDKMLIRPPGWPDAELDAAETQPEHPRISLSQPAQECM
jgi:hypothetical protein